MEAEEDAQLSSDDEWQDEIAPHLLNLEDAAMLANMLGGLQQEEAFDVVEGGDTSSEGQDEEGYYTSEEEDDGDGDVVNDTDESGSEGAEEGVAGDDAQYAQLPEGSSDDGADVDSSDTDSDDEYRRKTTKKVSTLAAAFEAELSAGVSMDLPTAVQRGCLQYALPDACSAYACSTKAQHFQTMDCLAVIPPPPSPQQRPAPTNAHCAQRTALPGSVVSQPRSPASSAAGTIAQAVAGAGTSNGGAPGGAAPAAGAVGAQPARQAAGGQAAAPLHGEPAAAAAAPMAPPAGWPAEGEDLEVLLGGPTRLTVCRVPAPGRPGPLLEVCSSELQTNHYSVAVSPDGRFVAAGGDRGFLYIYAYVRESRATANSSGGAAAGSQQPSAGGAGGTSGTGPAAPPPGPAAPAAAGEEAQPAMLVRLASFAFPVRGGFWGMNNMVRFGCFGGALRLLVAAQDKAIYIFNVPQWDGSAASLPGITDHRLFVTDRLPHWTAHWEQEPSHPAAAEAAAAAAAAAAPPDHQQPPAPPQQPGAVPPPPTAAAAAPGSAAGGRSDGGGGGGGRRYPNAGAARYWSTRASPTSFPQPDITPGARTPSFLVAEGDGGDGAAQLVLQDVPSTCALVGWPSPLNCVEPSGDGAWLAVGCDEPLLYLVPSGPDYPSRPIETLLVPLPPSLPGRLAPGCQYCKFNPDGSRLAASFDALYTVFVFDVVRRQLLFDMRHTQWQPPLALAWLPGGSTAGAGGGFDGPGGPAGSGGGGCAGGRGGRGCGVLLHAVDRQHLVAVDVDAPRPTMTRISIKPPGLRAQAPGHPAQPPQQSEQPHSEAGPGQRQQHLQEQPGPSQGATHGSTRATATGSGGGDGGGEGRGGGGATHGSVPGSLAAHLASVLGTRKDSAEAYAMRRERRRRERPTRITGMATTPDGRLLVTTKTELLTFRLLLPDAPWSRALHRHLPPAFRDAVRTLLLGASAKQTSAAAAASNPELAAADTGSLLRTSSDASQSAASAAAAARADGDGRRLGLASRPTGLSRLPHDALELIVAAASQPRLAWASTPVEEVLAYPELDGWAPGWEGSARRGDTEAAAAALGRDRDPWADWDVGAR